MDYSFFDGLIDSVFVINNDRGIIYCNEAAAKLCDSSVRRLAKGKPIYEVIEFSNPDLFVMPKGEVGKSSPAPYVELRFNLKAGKQGKVQIAIQPFSDPAGEPRWAVMIRDVTLEEVLHGKYHKQLEEKEVYIQQLQDAQKQLEAYSKNLEQMVEARTLEVKKANVMLSAIMNSLGQGFLVFDEKGICSDFYTKACEDILEGSPANKKIWDVLKVKDLETFHLWLQALYGEKLPFEVLKDLGPALYPHSLERHIKLDYFPLRNETNKINQVVVVATDKTSEFLANRALEKEKKYAKMVVKLVTGKKQFVQFIDNVKNCIFEVKKLINIKENTLDHSTVFRILHTLEGEAATYSAADIWSASRETQEIIEPLKKGQKADINEIKNRLGHAINSLAQVYEKFMAENADLFRLVGVGKEGTIEISAPFVERVIRELAQKGVSESVCDFIANELLREPVSIVLNQYQDVVDIVAQKMNKAVNPIKFYGEDTRLYLDSYKDLFSTLVHAFRNAVDHGIESPEEREMMGKDRSGQICVYVEMFESQNQPSVRIKIEDDGQGINTDLMRKRLDVLLSPEKTARLSDFEVMQYVFESGLSTKNEVGEFSGRGIGLNAVKTEGKKAGGKVWIESQTGKGTKLIIEVPDLKRVDRHLVAA